MTLESFLQSDALVADWRKLYENSTVHEVLVAMMESAPVNDFPKSDVSATFASYNLGFQQGYAFYARRLKLLTQNQLAGYRPMQTSYEPAQE